jgi:cytochrome c551
VTLAVIIVLFAFGIAVPALVIADNAKNHAATAPGGVTLNAEEQHGRYLFGQACAVCHTLSASQAHGHTGPNLDILQPPAALVYDAVVNGRARGNGNMPAALYTGVDAQAVAAYVAAVAGR